MVNAAAVYDVECKHVQFAVRVLWSVVSCIAGGVCFEDLWALFYFLHKLVTHTVVNVQLHIGSVAPVVVVADAICKFSCLRCFVHVVVIEIVQGHEHHGYALIQRIHPAVWVVFFSQFLRLIDEGADLILSLYEVPAIGSVQVTEHLPHGLRLFLGIEAQCIEGMLP